MSSPEELEEFISRTKQDLERLKRKHEAAAYAQKFWTLLVGKVGESQAKEIMHHLMGDKKPGPARADEDLALIYLIYFIYGHILHFGRNLTDGKIAKLILASNPYYAHFDSGLIFLMSNVFSESIYDLTDDPIVGREPFNMQFSALKKQVERLRRWAIDELLLSKKYAPRQYYRGINELSSRIAPKLEHP